MFFTDPVRTPDPDAIAERLPTGSAVVYRAFGAAQAEATARRLRAIATRRGLVLLIGADPALAEAVAADGLHMPERLISQIPALKAQHPAWLITAAAHDAPAATAASRAGVDAIVVSPVFASLSPSAGKPLGLDGLKGVMSASGAPAYALGGVTGRTAAQLLGSEVIGFAGVEAFSPRT